MTLHQIAFPALGLEFSIDSVAFSIGSWRVYWYGIIIACGFALAVLYCTRRCKQNGISPDDLLDMLIFGVPLSVIGARLYYCIFHFSEYASDPGAILRIWDGGLAIYGGVIVAIAVVIVFTRVKKIKTGAMLDLVAMGFLIGQIIGRWGNFCNAECFGRDILPAADGSLPFYAMQVSTHPGAAVHPLFFYESMLNLVLFLVLHFLFKKRKFDGQIFLGYMMGYGVIRFCTEGIRNYDDALKIWNTDLRVSQLLAAVFAVAGLVLMIVGLFRIRARKNQEAMEAAIAGEPEIPETPEESEAEEPLADQPEDFAYFPKEELDSIPEQTEEKRGEE